MNSYRYPRVTVSFGGPLTRAVKTLLVINGAVFVLRFLLRLTGEGNFFDIGFGLVPDLITREFYLWQFFTYMFIHSGPFHLLFNMLVLWMFGGDLERAWGYGEFLRYYVLTGLGAGLCSYGVAPTAMTITVGASGAIFGLLLAYGVLFAERIIYLYFLFPIKAKYFVMIMGALEFYAALTSSGSGISNSAHLGGMIFGFLYLRRHRWGSDLRTVWSQWKLQRARRQFKAYTRERERDQELKRRDEDRDPPPTIQ